MAIPTFVRPSAIAASTSRSRGVSAASGSSAPAADHELGDHLGIERRAAASDPAQGVHELADVADAVLQQVADAAGAVREELGRVLALDVLAEHQDRRARARAGAPRSPPAGPRRAGVGGIRTSTTDTSGRCVDDGLDERRAVADLGDDRAARLLDQPGDALADERRVLGDDDAQVGVSHRSHGMLQ